MKVLNFGSMNLDHVYRIHDFPKAGETLLAMEQSVNPGGKGLNQSIALAKAGVNVYHAGAMGLGGQMLVDVMKEYGVDTSFVRCVDELQGNAVIYVNDEGENNIVLYGGSNRQITSEQIEETLDGFSEGDYLLLQNEVNLLPEIVSKAHKRGLNIVLNPSPCDDKLKEVDFNLLSMTFINEIEGEQLTGETKADRIMDAILERFPDIKIVLTLGSEGAYYCDANMKIFQESIKTDVIDTTAAGDTFSGYFLACYLSGENVRECMFYAAKAAAIAVSRRGAGESIPLHDEVFE